jgi:hypothetical protein
MPRRSKLAILPALAAVTACNGSQASAPAEPTRAEQMAALQIISARCHLPEGFFELSDSGLSIKALPDQTFASVDCAFKLLRTTPNAPQSKMGFVGNEQPAPKEPDAPSN